MAVQIKTLDELYNDILNDYATELGVDVSDLGTQYQVDAKVQAGEQYTLWLLLSVLQKNQFYDTAEESQLIRYGQQLLGRSPAQATQGQYTVQVTGQIGSIIPASTQFKADDSIDAAGYLFILDNEFELTAETDTITLRSLTAGIDPLLYINDTLTSTQPIVNVDNQATVLSVTVQPSAAEDIESYRADVLQFVRAEPQGGSPSDYRLWASDVPEVRTVYPYLKAGSPGDIEVYIEATKENSKPLGIIGEPTDQTIGDVYTPQIGATPESGALIYNSSESRGRKPIGVFNIFPLSVNPIAVDVYFEGLTDESINTQLRSVIDDLMYEVRPFIAGADNLTDKNDILTVASIISETIQLIAGTGIIYNNLTMQIGGLEVTNYQFTDGYYPYLRNMYNNGIAF